MVQITHARQRNSDTGAYELVPAVDFDKKTDGQKICFCPDEQCGATLTHYQSYYQTFYSPLNNEPYKLKIAAHFKREPGSPQHDIACTAVEHYAAYQNFSRELGASLGHGAFVFNLNIPTNTFPAPTRQNVDSHIRNFNEAALAEKENKNSPSRKLSAGLNDVKKLAQLLDSTEFDRQYRESIALRNGNKYYKLSDLFEDDALTAFRSHHDMARKCEQRPAIIQFKPIAIGKYHSKKNGTIQGQAVPIKGGDGKDYSVSMMLHCDSPDVYDSVKKEIRNNERSFLVYTDKSYVNLQEFSDKKHAIQDGSAKDNSVLVHLHVKTNHQICAWMPTDGQLELEEAGLELPQIPVSSRETPQAASKNKPDPSLQLNLF